MSAAQSKRKILIYSHDAAIRRAYAIYLTRNGIPTDSCGDIVQLLRLLSWHEYDFILINVDDLQHDPTLDRLDGPLDGVVARHQKQANLIATGYNAAPQLDIWTYRWFIQEPLTPKRILTTISRIYDQQSRPEKQFELLRLRRHLAKPIAL